MQSAYISVFRWLPIALLGAVAAAQQPARPAAPGAMLQGGIVTLETPEFTLKLVRSSQTVAALQPKADPKFDFTARTDNFNAQAGVADVFYDLTCFFGGGAANAAPKDCWFDFGDIRVWTEDA